jgi:4-hydroxy-3-methylbut-2-enyl diphosphate reductase
MAQTSTQRLGFEPLVVLKFLLEYTFSVDLRYDCLGIRSLKAFVFGQRESHKIFRYFMKLILSKPRGFCAGVVRAIDCVERALEIYGAPIYVKHQIVHNQHVVERLENKGAIFIEDLKEVPEGSILIYSAHGVSPQVRAMAKERNLKEIDATCSLVTRVHSAVQRYAAKGYQILLIGHKDHVETIGTAGEAPDQTTIVESVSDVDGLDFCVDQPLFYITQTTLSLDDVQDIVEALKQKFPHIETLPSSSICYATTNRQLAIKDIAYQCDVIFVIGDMRSSNSNRLVEVAKSQGVDAYLVHDAHQIQSCWLDNKQVIGMTAGASTPEDIVQACICKLQTLGVDSIEEVELLKEEVFFQLPKQLLGAQTSFL